ncbi:hypothetical protein [Halpernia frigidisoli]|uniref:Uncharacterized protein n=1 Tax=Halpernia frigidisoli TaxID=1125876 RepID=A0A1I3DXP6_9FLAO|nr:hypothetical protein [Halpernia frigidisoli]SFH91512.1 hypothetical protein SAMN05443292_0763 [Halpernia frigidisoli]
MKKFIYLSIAVASLTLVSFREEQGNSLKAAKNKLEKKQISKDSNYVKFDHTDNSLGDAITPPRD